MKSILAIAALVVPAGCIHLAGPDPWKSRDVISQPKPAARSDLAAEWRGEADPWKDAEKSPGAVIGGDSAFEKGRGAGAAPLDVRGGTSDVERELSALSSRVDRLERRAEPGASARTPRASAPAMPPERPVEIYKVDPSGQTAWIAAGSQRGMKKGQTLDVMRGGKAVAVARVVRVWPDTSELAILWANGKLQRGDSVVPR